MWFGLGLNLGQGVNTLSQTASDCFHDGNRGTGGGGEVLIEDGDTIKVKESVEDEATADSCH